MQLKKSSMNIENSIEQKYKKQLLIKQILDFVLSIFLLLLISPFFLVIVILIRLDSPGKAIFKQTRIGKGGKPFTIYKFRTMVNNAEVLYHRKIAKENLKELVFQDKQDFRITRVGKFLRKTSLDELPQLLNVLNGTMSLIGPRPEVSDVVQHYSEEDMKRLLVKPGITGLAQVNGRGDLQLAETISYDLEYVKNYGLLLDLRILLKTFVVVFTGKGAY